MAAFVSILALLLVPFFVTAQEFKQNLFFGMRNSSEVVRLQELLRTLGYFTYPSSTGNYLSVTVDAVKRFQKAEGLPPVGGYFGPQSRAAANRILAVRQKPTPPPSAPPQTPAPPPGFPVATSTSTPSDASPYRDKITIGELAGRGAMPEDEYLVLQNRTVNEAINVSGFVIRTVKGESFTIPLAHVLPGFYAEAGDPIVLVPGGRVVIAVGRQSREMNFRKNLCTGYFDETSRFIPSLSHQCLRPDVSRSRTLSDRCIKVIEGTPSCRTVSGAGTFDLDHDCAEYIAEHFNYAGCVKDYRNRKDFYSNEWMVWMQRPAEFFNNRYESVIVKDREGRVVAIGEY